VIKKISILAAFVLTAASAFPFGVGLRAGGSIEDAEGGGGLLFSPEQAWHFGLNYYIGPDSGDYWGDDDTYHEGGETYSVGLTADYWMVDMDLKLMMGKKQSVNFYIGSGFYTYFRKTGGDSNYGAGLRVPVGLDLQFEYFDVFVELAPQLGLRFLPEMRLNGEWFTPAVGFRCWPGKRRMNA
jgi:hypothetical protein